MAIEFLKKLSFLFEPARLKIIYGGRNAGKTEGVCTALPMIANSRKLRILCLRELQNSIAESTFENLKNRITDIGLYNEFNFQKTTIQSLRSNSEFLFSGLRYNIDKIKSMSRIDIAWIEEARNVSKVSLDKLEPTIRGRHEDDVNGMGGPFGLGPEIWATYNPELDSDEIHTRYVVKKEQYAPDFLPNVSIEDRRFYYFIREKLVEFDLTSLDKLIEYGISLTDLEKQRYLSIRNKRYAFVVKVNWSDNKFFPPDQRQLMELAKAANEDEWLHVWEGNTKQVLDGAIYAEEIKKVLLEGRRGKVPYDPSRVVHVFFDLGHDDYTSMWFIQQIGVEYNVINFFQDRLKKIPYYIQELQKLEYNYGYLYLPHDGDNETLASRSPAKIFRDAFPGKVKIVPRVAKKVHGIRAARVIFDLCNFDIEATADGWQCLCRYQYAVNEETGSFSKEPLHNEYSHGADAFQTFALSLKSETQMKPKVRTIGVGRTIVPFRQSNSWMG